MASNKHSPVPESSPPSLLAISQSDTPGYSRLPGTVAEVQAIKTGVKSSDVRFSWLNGEKATVEAVLRGMEDHSWCHFACHGVQHPADPTKSAFALHDGPLDLKTIMSKSFKSAEIAFLSACQTATGDEKRPEEAVHLAAGMLMAGYRSVFATMWSIGDNDAPVVAEEVYAYLLKGRRMERWREAYALHHALNRLREKVGEEAFVKWVPFVHFGG